jgi:hypothetical protein
MRNRLLILAVSATLTVSLGAPELLAADPGRDWEDVLFPAASAKVVTDLPALQRLAALLSAHRDYRVRLIGNCDSLEAKTTAQADALALARAGAVRDFLLKFGAAPDQVRAASEGSKSPLGSNQTPEGRFVNRRVQIEVTDASGRLISAACAASPLPSVATPAEETSRRQANDTAAMLKRLDKLDDLIAGQYKLNLQMENMQRLAGQATGGSAGGSHAGGGAAGGAAGGGDLRGIPPAVTAAPPPLRTGSAPEAIRNRGRNLLLEGQKEPGGYGIYSYLLFAAKPRNEQEKDRFLDLLTAFLDLGDITAVENTIRADSGPVDRKQLHLAMVPAHRQPTKLGDATELLNVYDFDKAGVLLSNLGVKDRGGPVLDGAYFAWSLTPVSGGRPQSALEQNLNWVPPGDLPAAWYRILVAKAEQPQLWNKKSFREYALSVQTSIEYFAQRVPATQQALLTSLSWFGGKSWKGLAGGAKP